MAAGNVQRLKFTEIYNLQRETLGFQLLLMCMASKLSLLPGRFSQP